ncbi:MAG: hypothetical protein KDC44_21140, partial [Phaeodactylibacter sp.]|nr:hypothetical protein [Phaeodactylibacter sp.]
TPQTRPASEPASRCMQVRNAKSDAPIESYLAEYPNGNCAKEARELLQSWRDLQAISDLEQLVEWNQKHPDSQFGDEAEKLAIQLSPMNANWTDFENQFEVEISNYVRPTVSRIEGWNDQFFSIDTSQLAREGKFSIKIEEGANVIIYIQDLGKSMNNRLPINLSNKLNVDVDSTGGNAYSFTFQGGESPFQIEVTQNNRTVHRKKAESGNKVVLTKAELLALGLTGPMKVIARSAYSFTDELPAIYVEDSSLPIPIELMALIGFLLLGVIIFLIVKSGQRRRKLKEQEEFQQNFQKEKETKNPVPPITTHQKTTTTNLHEAKTEEIGPVPPVREVKPEANPPKKEGIVIRSVRKETTAEGQEHQPAFAEVLSNGSFYKLDLTGLWADTSVLNVHMGKQPIREIDIYLRSTTANEGKEQEGKIPEIGGFLMGQFEEKGLYYDIAITKFVPIAAANQNAYKLEF